MVGYPRVPAGRLVVERSRRRSRGPARHQAPCRHSRVAAAPKNACALDGFGCPTEAPYGCFLPDLTRFGTCRHPNPSNALGARYILPAPARWGKTANLGRGFFDYFLTGGIRLAKVVKKAPSQIDWSDVAPRKGPIYYVLVTEVNHSVLFRKSASFLPAVLFL